MSELGNEREDARQNDVARRAYERWLARGGDHGRHVEDWIEAEREVHGSPERAEPERAEPEREPERPDPIGASPNEPANAAMSEPATSSVPPARSAPKRRSRAKRRTDEPDAQG